MPDHSRPSLKLVLGLLLAFALLSLADLFLTWKLIHLGDGQVLECNPVAGWWLTTYGWGGLTAFKVGMMLLVGGLVGGISCWRPRTGERVLLFGCGAQSAILLYSVLLTGLVADPGTNPLSEVYWSSGASQETDPRIGSPRVYNPFSLPQNGMLLLLAEKSVREELGLSEAQAIEVAQLAGKRQELRQGFRHSSRDEWNANVQQLLAQEQSLIDNLAPEQAKRLQQIAWQQRGPFTLGDPQVREALGLTVEQEKMVRTILDEADKARFASFRARGPMGGPPRSAANDLNRTKDQLWAVLTTDQTAKWKELVGDVFKGDLIKSAGTPDPVRDWRRPPRW